MRGYRNYIPSPKFWKEVYKKYAFKIVDKFPIKDIKRKKLINEVNMNDVHYMLMNFYREAWHPVTLNKKGFLIDGQHRLELAKLKGLEYIDVKIDLDE